MRVLFMGTPTLAADVLSAIAGAHEVVAAFTRPDAVRGRGRALVGSAVKQRADELGIPVFTPTTLRDDAAAALVRSLEPELVCVTAYGALLPASILAIPEHGCINVHTSILPRWRGAAPIQRAILADDEWTGVSIMLMEEGLDTGPYCLQSEVRARGRSLADLEADLAQEGAALALRAIELIASGQVAWTPQPPDGVTYAQKIDKRELWLDPAGTAQANLARVRASSDAHPARATIAGKSVTVVQAGPAGDDAAQEACAELAAGEGRFAAKRLFAKADGGAFEVLSVKPDGKKQMDARSFAAGIQGIKGKTIRWGRP